MAATNRKRKNFVIPRWRNRNINSTYRARRLNRDRDIKEDKNLAVTLLKKTGICIVIVLFILLVKSFDTPFTNQVASGINTAITSEFNVIKHLGRLKFVETVFPRFEERILSVFKEEKSVEGSNDDSDMENSDNIPDASQPDIDMIAPLEGILVLGYGNIKHPIYNKEIFHKGIEIKSEGNTNVYAAADGVVLKVSENFEYGKYIQIEHKDSISSIYGQCSNILVMEGDMVKQGQIIADIRNEHDSSTEHLYFQVLVKDKPIDPLSVIRKEIQMNW